MDELTSRQKKYLRGLAHELKPVVLIGRHGITPSVANAVKQALADHELIKIKFNECKERELKKNLVAGLQARCDCHMVGLIGHVGIFYRQHSDPDKQRIALPPALR